MTDLSVIIPVYNGEKFIGNNLAELDEYLNRNFLSYEIIVIDDGSTDNTLKIIKRQKSKSIHPVQLEKNHGKGFAVKVGMNESRGRCCMFMDADLPFDLQAILYAWNTIVNRNFHMVVGDRSLMNSLYYSKLGLTRKIATTVFQFFTRTIVTGGFFDTQCGFKAFHGDIAKALFPILKFSGFEFDVELIYIASKYNMEIKKIPVRLMNNNVSTVNPFKDGPLMLLNILSLRRNWLSGKYHSETLRNMCEIRYWIGEQ